MTREKRLDDLEVSEEDSSKIMAAMRLQDQNAIESKLLKTKHEMLTPRGRAEMIVVDNLEEAGNALTRLLNAVGPEGESGGAQNAHAQFVRTQFAAIQYVIDSARGIISGKEKDKRSHAPTNIAQHAMTQALAKRMAQRSRPRIVEAAIPAIAEDDAGMRSTSVVHSDNVSATPEAGGTGDTHRPTSAVNEATATDDQGGLGG